MSQNEGKANPEIKKGGRAGERAKHLRAKGKKDANKRARKIANNLKENGIDRISMADFIELMEADVEIDEVTSTGSVQGYGTPFAFTKPEFEDEKDEKNAKLAHGTIAKKIDEATYREFRNDKTRTPRQKIGHSIKKMNGMLYRMEIMIRQSKKLKNEIGVSPEQYWGSTHRKLERVTRRMINVAKALQELKAENNETE